MCTAGGSLPGHVDVVRRLLPDPLTRDDVTGLGGLLAPVRDHTRATPPRSATPRRRTKPGES